MLKFKSWIAGTAVALCAGGMGVAPVQAATVKSIVPGTVTGQGSAVITGVVKDAAGKPMEGVIISARQGKETWTTSVYSNQQGRYEFPPTLTAGQYSVWAQAKGYDVGKADFALANKAKLTRDFTLKPLTDPRIIANQLDGPEWQAALPEANDHDRRMKNFYRNNCTSCHPPSYVLAARFDQRGWKTIIDMMTRGIPPVGRRDAGEGKGFPVWRDYMDDVSEYWARVLPTLEPKPGLPTMGAATRAVIVEYDQPYQNRPAARHNGTIWTEGNATVYEGAGPHDTWPDQDGNVWVSDDRAMGRTTARLDWRTGKWTDFMLPQPADGLAVTTHGLNGNQNSGIFYMGTFGNFDGSIIAFDIKKEKLLHFPYPKGWPITGGQVDVDSHNVGWAPAGEGVISLNARTGEYTFWPIPYPAEVPAYNRLQYGIGVDAQDQVWVARPGMEAVGWLNPKTGETGHVIFDRLPMAGLTDKEKVAHPMQFNLWGPPNGRAPRRLGSGGPNGGNYMWVALNKSDEMAQIDIRTKTITKIWSLPAASAPYDADVDREGNVWVPCQNSDRIYKINPKTGEMLEFQLPTRGTDIRQVQIDDNTSPVSVWINYNRPAKTARLQERPLEKKTKTASIQ